MLSSLSPENPINIKGWCAPGRWQVVRESGLGVSIRIYASSNCCTAAVFRPFDCFKHTNELPGDTDDMAAAKNIARMCNP
jgi:hypothetical protein